jgi:hypothetical protein
MQNNHSLITPSTIKDLIDRVEYEMWLLEAVYEIVEDPLSVKVKDQLIYPPSGDPPRQIQNILAKSIVIGDWRAGFLDAGAPLVFVTTFKILDMFMEWVLEQN